MSCKICYEGENKQYKPGLVCKNCLCLVHLDCLWRPGTPGDLAGDVFFEFTCGDCSKDRKEVFKRDKFPWVNVIYLTLHHLNIHSHGISNHGFFHYKTHICAYIDRHWVLLFGPNFKQKKNWIGTIAGVLSVYNNVLFQSGLTVLTSSGWWRLQHNFSPAVAAHILQEITRDKPKGGRARSHNLSMDRNIFLEKVVELGYKDLIVEDREAAVKSECDAAPAPLPPAHKKRRLDTEDIAALSSNSYYEYFVEDARRDSVEDSSQYTALSDPETSFRGFDYPQMSLLPPSDSSSLHSHQHSVHNYDSDSRSGSPYHHISDDGETKPDLKKLDVKLNKRPALEDTPTIVPRDSLFSKELNSVDMPWLPAKSQSQERSKDLVELTDYEEVQLLKQVENLIPKVRDPNKKAYLRRFRAKLALRRLKRHRHLPIFSFDKTMKVLGGQLTEDSKVMANAERVLDRFQRSYLLDNLSGTVQHTTFGTLLLSHIEPTMFQSPHSGTVLKPYIRRDTESKPLWLNLMDELLMKANRHVKQYVPPPRASVDYSYVRPQHIAAVNNLCAQYFWPGIDLTEALQYPEFSCVVTYRRLVVGCAFLVPDVKYNEAYISFILTRPEWRSAKIATFMLYHLLQTCTGKDVTLHVSPTNPAIFLYQKFGFKVEELIQDFYEKYFDIDYKGCRHALFLRLSR